MNILLIGPPGSGKGTQGQRLAARFDLEHLATGDLLRAEVEGGTPIGRQVSELMRNGELVPDSTIIEMTLPRVLEASDRGGYVLDGFPRTVDQAVEARKLAESRQASPHAVIYLEVPREELMRRILARAETEDRTDDNEDTVRNRLRVFDEATSPLIEHYRERGLLHVIAADRSEDEVTEAIVAALPDA